jgi:hypothetical protein
MDELANLVADELEVFDSEFCCGLFEIGNFGTPESWRYDTGCNLKTLTEALVTAIKADMRRCWGPAFIATTVPGQKHAVAALKKLGFKRVGRFSGGEAQQVTLWFKRYQGGTQ